MVAAGSASKGACGSASDGPKTLTVLDTWAALERVGDAWRAWQHNPNADIDFYRFILGVRAECEHPYVVCVEDDAKTQALLVGRVERVHVPIRVGYFKIAQPEIRLITFLEGGLLGQLDEPNADRLVRFVLDRMAAGDADAAFFGHVRQNSALVQSLKRFPRRLRRDAFPAVQPHRSMTIPDSLEAFYASLSPKVRKNQKWQAKKLVEAYAQQVAVRCYTREQDLDVLFRDVDRIASATYQRGLGVGFADTPEMRGRMQLEASKGWMQAFVLYLAGQPAAFWIGTRYRNRFFSDFMGYDSAHAKYSPGMYLILQGIERLCQETGPNRVTELDFGLGDAQYKQVLGTDGWMEESLYLYSPSLRGAVLNLSRTLTGMIERSARAVLRKLQLENYFKASWRKRLAAK
jgi:hypothetical protein